MTQPEDDRIRRLYTMGYLPVLRCIDSDLSAGTAYINEHFAGEMASLFGRVKKSGAGRERGLETLANYTRAKNIAINIG